MSKTNILAIPLALALAPAVAAGQGQDVTGSSDHPMISRYEGARIAGHDESSYDEYVLALGPVNSSYAHSEPLAVEGRMTRILYQIPEGRTPLEVYRNYERALDRGGFEVLWQCSEQECGRLFQRIAPHGRDLVEYAFSGAIRGHRYLAARAAGPDGGDVYVALNVAHHGTPVSWLEGHTIVRLDVVEVEPMEEDLVTVDAAAMREDISTDGKAVLYGISFETDRADLRPESDATLEQIVTLLADDPDLHIHVVGHTDDQGTLDYNLDLSARRAAAVKAALVERYGVNADRLVANGVGPLAPVAPNGSEDGRARNRRVELVPIRQ